MTDLSFTVSHQHLHCKARTGQIKHPQRPCPIQTPCVWPSAQRGILPSVTPDQLESSSEELVSGVHIALEHLLDHAPPLYKRNPTKDASLAGYFGYPQVAQNGPLLLMGIKDPARLVISENNSLRGTSGDHHVGIQTVKGFAKLTLADYLSHVLPSPAGNQSRPDMLICMTDEPDDALPSKKRLHKSIQRSTQWTHQVSQAIQSHNIPLLVTLVGSSNPDARLAFSQDLVDPDTAADFSPADSSSPPPPAIDQSIWGYVLRLPPLAKALSSTHICDLYSRSLEVLPQSKLRLALCPSGPHAILHLIRHVGSDSFVEDFTFGFADAGVALDFDFGSELQAEAPMGQDLGINLFDPVYEHDFKPLSSSLLAQSSSQEQPVTRAYLHHLLNVHELSAHILLTLHNTRVLHAFTAKIRELINQGQDAFIQQYDAFMARYAEPKPGEVLPSVQAGLAARARVNKERGKGRQKGALSEKPTVDQVPIEQQVIDN